MPQVFGMCSRELCDAAWWSLKKCMAKDGENGVSNAIAWDSCHIQTHKFINAECSVGGITETQAE